jgi:hypothetical protein
LYAQLDAASDEELPALMKKNKGVDKTSIRLRDYECRSCDN